MTLSVCARRDWMLKVQQLKDYFTQSDEDLVVPEACNDRTLIDEDLEQILRLPVIA